MLQLLNLAIGLSFIYLLFSLLLTALNELILCLPYWDKRAALMKEGLRQLLGNNDATVNKFLDHGLIDGLSKTKGGTPSYISPEAFVGAVLDLVSPAKAAQARTIADITEALGGAALEANPKLKESLLAILDAAGHDLDQFESKLEVWFNQGMDRVTGWYKRYTQQVLFGLGLVLAVGCNVDSIHIVRSLSSDPKALQATVAQAVETVQKQPSTKVDVKAAVDLNIEQAIQNVSDSLATLNGLSIPIGWSPAQQQYLAGSGAWFGAFFGYLLTALAASLGAPFWFDTLNRFVNIRGNGLSPAEAKAKVP